MKLKFKNPVDQEFFRVTKDLTIDDWRNIRDEDYWTEYCPIKEKIIPSTKLTRLRKIKEYLGDDY